jgi:pyruvate dehydrogenase E1 component
MELPHLVLYEPAFSRELEWTLLEALRACCDRENGYASYLRLSTKPVDQSLIDSALRRLGEDELRRQVLAGGYRLLDSSTDGGPADGPVVEIFSCGALITEALSAAHLLWEEGVAANVINLTSADRVYTSLRTARRDAIRNALPNADAGYLGDLIPPSERRTPIVSVLDGASHTLAFLGTAYGAPQVSLGVDDFGQSGTRADLYQEYSIDPDSIVNAAVLALELAKA